MTARPGCRRPKEQGSATVYGVAFIGLLVVVAMIAATVAALLVGHRRAAAGADLAALAGASAIQQGRPPCVEAARLARANRVLMLRCVRRGQVVTVVVATDVVPAIGPAIGQATGPGTRGTGTGSGGAPGSGWTVRSMARAGPVA
ncbi:MAG: hypothetical protein AVDCRST_MAG72-249 [uncultured Nocardioidaceae bacterium]|uniref:Putative Flp pilus-assembly TadG-like N-terminal domain-containing protein n=1 Tax=uncultured Nocardioidaceae bacterium TaxID=253824 RepID=A0A6J4LGS9_9ACTN|nr:MAG: hypothetical protein AVDCRST_MAG72-249 [uncultured Nocardioidaceae bacterium]